MVAHVLRPKAEALPGDHPLYIDWAKPKKADGSTKGLAIAGPDVRSRRITLEALVAEFPPPRALYVEGIPTVRRDELLDLGYEVWYCNTRQLAILRRRCASGTATSVGRVLGAAADSSQAGASVERPNAGDETGARPTKGDLKDAAGLYMHAAAIRWYRAVRTEPEVEEAIRLFKNRDLIVSLSKLAAQHAHSETYRDSEFFAAQQAAIEGQLKEATRAIEWFCREIGLHGFHAGGASGETPNPDCGAGTSRTTYGLSGSCITIVAGLARRPWIFSRKAWRHLNGVTDHAWNPEHAQRRSMGCDITLKRLVNGAIQNYLKAGSPYRARYDELKAGFGTTVKPGKPGHGSYKVTAHAKAVNRAITTPVIDNIRAIVRAWYTSRRASGEHDRTGLEPGAAANL